MQHRLFDYKPIRTNDFVLSEIVMPILGYKKLRINATKDKYNIIILLLNVAYIINYLINHISINIIENKRVH